MDTERTDSEAQAIQTEIVFNEEQWDEFCAMLERPPLYLPRLQELMSEPSILEVNRPSPETKK